MKGVEDPVITYQLVGPKARPEALRGIEGMRTPLIGRQSEFMRLQRAIDTAIQEQRGELVLVEGEAGIGKSRLVSELKDHLGKAPWRILEGRSLTYRRSIPYWIFIELMRGYFGIHGEQADAEIRERLAQKTSRTLGEQSKEVLPYLEHLFSLSPSEESDAERLRYLEGEQLRQQIFLAVQELWVAEARRQPLFLILEDLHWADEASIKLFVFLLNSLKHTPLVLCGVSRSFSEDGLSEIISKASRRLPEHFQKIKVKPLSKTQSEELFSRLVGDADLPKTFVKQIIQRSSGNPLFLEELLRMLIDSNQIIRKNGTWKLGEEGESIGIPATLEALALTRFDRLLPEQRRIVQVAAVIGRDFNFNVLSEVADVASQQELETVLALLVKRGFIQHKSKTEKQNYLFRHVITSDAIYGTLLRKERKELHEAVGAAIEKVYADRINEHVELLARHYSWSSNLERALHYLILAGKRASRAYVNNQARGHYEQALEILPHVEHNDLQKLQIYVGLADVLLFVGEYEGARKHYHEALEVVEHAPEQDEFIKTQVAVCRKIGTTFERQGDFQNALSHLEDAQQLFFSLDSEEIFNEGAKIKNEIGWIHFRQGEGEQAERYLREALEIVQGSSHYQVIASILNRLGGVYFQKGELAQAADFLRKSLVLQEEIGDLAAVARSYNNLGLLEWRRENWDNALKNYEQSMELNASLGDIEATIHLQGNIGILYIDKGDLRQAKYHLEQCLNKACDIGHSFLEGAAYLQLALYWMATREWDKTIDYCERSLRIYNEIGSQESFVDLYWCKGEAYLGLGEFSKAEKSCKAALESIDKAPAGQYTLEEARVVRLEGKIAFKRGDLKTARKLLNRSMEKFVSLGNKLEIGRTATVLAKLIKEEGDFVDARVQASEARLIFQSLGAKLDLKELEKVAF
ncbi:MAG: Photosystem I assembly protein Ycf3 [Chloroflexi bacterium]|nr:Photosystem I assembly protein Ycf3 [Chloroflexota bacterium]